MSLTRNASQITVRAAAMIVVALSSSGSATAQYSVQTYVCQTPTFWCAIQFASGVPNGTSCYCNTLWGPVGGYSINPAGVPNAPKLPTPQTQSAPSRPPQNQGSPGQVAADDCYKGLGNCPGSFTRNSAGGAGGDSPGIAKAASAFGTALETLISAAADAFNSVKGKEDTSYKDSDSYDTTVVPKGLDFCTLYVPYASRRAPWVSCFAKDGTSFGQLVTMVAQALGSAGTRGSDGQTWEVGNTEISVGRDTPLTVDIRPKR
jgi:hypothetical protein